MAKPNRRDRGQSRTSRSGAPPCGHLPRVVQEAWATAWKHRRRRIKNLSLLLDRYAPWVMRNGSWNLDYKQQQGQGAKGRWLRDWVGHTSRSGWIMVDNEQMEALRGRFQAILSWYEQRGMRVLRFRAEPVWRFVVGLGAAHVLETSLTLHRLWGLPIIPASGLKGAARAYAAAMGQTESEAFRQIFGTPEQAGAVVFFDALPGKHPKFAVDIMNPHYPHYYRGEKYPPADWDSPRPVFFLTVCETPYLFALAARRQVSSELLDTAAHWLKGALTELGIGAKTSADYGYWAIIANDYQ